MKKLVLMLLVAAVVVGCNRDETFTPVPNQPITQAPTPTAPTTPTTPTDPSDPTFQPQLPTGQGQQYVIFLPIDYYFRMYGYQAYWSQMWSQWQQVAYYYGTTPYDFNTFWFQYCPQVWYGTPMWNVYQYVDQSFYSWVSPYQQVQTSGSASYFWQYYYGYGYGGNTCGSCY